MASYPPLHIFNEDDEMVGETMLEEILQKGLLHRVIHILVEDQKGNVLLQFRGPNVHTDPNTWDFAVGGYVDAGENYLQAAKRELQEELGIFGVALEDLGVDREKEVISGYEINRFVGNFKAIIPSNTALVIEDNEVAKVQWFTKSELKQLINDETSKVPLYLRQWLTNYYFKHENYGH